MTMNHYPIDKDIPLPKKTEAWNRYPWGEMDVGHSFFVPAKAPATLSSAAVNFTRRSGKDWKFHAEFEMKDGVHGARIWRVA